MQAGFLKMTNVTSTSGRTPEKWAKSTIECKGDPGYLLTSGGYSHSQSGARCSCEYRSIIYTYTTPSYGYRIRSLASLTLFVTTISSPRWCPHPRNRFGRRGPQKVGSEWEVQIRESYYRRTREQEEEVIR
jgi:hypothetical protein